MNDLNWDKVETIIDRVLELPESERQTFINQKCGDNKKLKSEVTLLLQSIFDSEGWLEDPKDYKKEFYEEIGDDVELIPGGQSLIGKEVGSYTIKEKIGEGGMGAVYRAERSDKSFEHQVAIKIIRTTKATHENIARFKREQNILAGLNHPGIARLFDGGVTGDGAPYIIMEYVNGTPIDDYCRKRGCSISEKLTLFEQMLQAVRYAHENLIIHRDLKPGNILVDQDENVKILDFGISKLLGDEDDTALTQTGARLLTPRYAAPEQVRQDNITTATDLYALGIVFYELLTGIHPFNFEELSRYEIEQAILNQDPKKPSTRVSDPTLQKKLQGDLDAIALKAIRKENDHRYRVANAFLDDLSNYRNGIPVSAAGDSFRYRSQKFFKRHKQAVAITTGILLLLIGLTGFYTWRIAKERDQAQFQAKRAEQANNFMLSIFDETNPELAKKAVSDLSARQLLSSGIAKADQELKNQPALYVEQLVNIGTALTNLDDYKSADKAFEKALETSINTYGENHLTTANVYYEFSYLKFARGDKGDVKQARNLIQKAINIHKINAEDDLTLANYYSRKGFFSTYLDEYKEALPILKKALNLYENSKSTETQAYAKSLKSIAISYSALGNYEKAIEYQNKALAIPNISEVVVLGIKKDLGAQYYSKGEYKKALKIVEETLQQQINLLGKVNSYIPSTLSRLVVIHQDLGNWAEAEAYARQALAVKKELYGEDNIHYINGVQNLAVILDEQGKSDDALSMYRYCVNQTEKFLGKDHPYINIYLYNLAVELQQQQLYDESYQTFNRLIALDREKLGDEHKYMALNYNKYAVLLSEMGRMNEAKEIFAKAEAIFQKKYDPDHYRIANYLVDVGQFEMKKNNFSKADSLFKTALNIFKETYDEDDFHIKETKKLIKESGKALTTASSN